MATATVCLAAALSGPGRRRCPHHTLFGRIKISGAPSGLSQGPLAAEVSPGYFRSRDEEGANLPGGFQSRSGAMLVVRWSISAAVGSQGWCARFAHSSSAGDSTS